jgi:hypothetical protein
LRSVNGWPASRAKQTSGWTSTTRTAAARAHRSTSSSFGLSAKAWMEMPCPVSLRLIAEAVAWSAASSASRTGVMKTEAHSGPMSARASMSA